MSYQALIVFSGGQDSTTCLYWALEQFASQVSFEERNHYIKTITINYGQRHSLELSSAQAICKFANIDYDQIDIPSVLRSNQCSLLNQVQVPQQTTLNAFTTGVANTFVPGRNMLFLTLAANIAVSLNIKNIVIGVCETDFAGYYDCRTTFIEAMQKAINQACFGTDTGITIHTPLMNYSKSQIIKLAQGIIGKQKNGYASLGAECMEAMAYTHTCYNGTYPPCGKCHACHLRAKGFSESGVRDPLLHK